MEFNPKYWDWGAYWGNCCRAAGWFLSEPLPVHLFGCCASHCPTYGTCTSGGAARPLHSNPYQYRPAQLVDRELYSAPLGPVGPKRAQRARGPKICFIFFGRARGPPGTFGNIFGIFGSGPNFQVVGPVSPLQNLPVISNIWETPLPKPAKPL